MNNIPQKPYKPLTPFGLFVRNNFPFVEATYEARDNYDLLCKIYQHLKTVEYNQGIAQENIEALYEFLNTLELQDEVNNKLDEMAESGQLQEIMASYLNSKAIFGFDNVEAMKNATNLIDGSFAKTLGFYEKDDGGMANYKIRSITNDDIIDNITIIPLNDETNNLIAELIIPNKLNLKILGCKADNVTDETQILEKAIELSNYIIIPNGTLIISNPILIPSNTTIEGLGDAKIKASSTFNVANYRVMFVNQNHEMSIASNTNIHFKNLTIENTNETSGHDGLIHFRGITESSIENVKFECYGSNVWGLILFSTCQNIDVDNITITNHATNQLGGCLWVRGGLSQLEYDGAKSFGIHISNSNFYNYAKDETVVFADGTAGSYVEVQMTNCNIEGKANSSTDDLPNFLLVVNSLDESSTLKVNIDNVNIKGPSSLYSMVIGSNGISTSKHDFCFNNIMCDNSVGGGIRSYQRDYIVNNAHIKSPQGQNGAYNLTLMNSFSNRHIFGCNMYNCTLICDDHGNGAEQCPIVKNCYIDAYNNGIKTYGTFTGLWQNNHIISTIGNGIYAQNNSTAGLENTIISGNYIERKTDNSNNTLAGINIPYAKNTQLVNNRTFGVAGNVSGNYKAFNYGTIKTNSTNVTETENNVTFISA